MTQVGAAVIRRRDKILLCKRGAGGSCAHLWEFPGGKLEPGECEEDCVRRECFEELGAELSLGKLLMRVRHVYPDREVELAFYLAELAEGSPEPERRVHEQLAWASPSELSDFAFCPADAPLIELLKTLEA